MGHGPSRFFCLTLLLALSAAACSGGPAREAVPPPQGSSAESAAPAAAPREAPPRPGASGAGEAGDPQLRLEVGSDRPVAEVNGVPISERRVLELATINKLRAEAEGQVVSDQDFVRVKAGALDLLIDGELMLQAARRQGLTVSPEQIEAEVRNVHARFGTDERYQQYLRDARVTEDDVRKEAERRLVMDAFRRSIVGRDPVSDADARGFYEENRDRFVEAEKARVAHILIRSKESDPKVQREQARKRIEEAHRRALAGEEFTALAKQFSQDPTATKGGDIGFLPRGLSRIFPKFEEVAFSTPVGSVSGVFETPNGFNVIKVIEKKAAQPVPFERARAEILLELGMIRDGLGLQARLAELRKSAKVRILDPQFEMPKEEPAAAAPSKAAPRGAAR